MTWGGGISISPGTKFGEWTVLSYAGPDAHGNRLFWCQCVCGSSKQVRGVNLRNGLSTKCKTKEKHERQRKYQPSS